MAGEIRVSVSLNVSNANYVEQFNKSISVDQSTPFGTSPGIIATTTDTAIDLSVLSSPGWCVLFNIDDTNYVVVGPDNGSGAMVPTWILGPGEFASMRLYPTVILRCQAHTADCDLQTLFLEG